MASIQIFLSLATIAIVVIGILLHPMILRADKLNALFNVLKKTTADQHEQTRFISSIDSWLTTANRSLSSSRYMNESLFSHAKRDKVRRLSLSIATACSQTERLLNEKGMTVNGLLFLDLQSMNSFLYVKKELQGLYEEVENSMSGQCLYQSDFSLENLLQRLEQLETPTMEMRKDIMGVLREEIIWQHTFVMIGPFWLPLLVPFMRVLQVMKLSLFPAVLNS